MCAYAVVQASKDSFLGKNSANDKGLIFQIWKKYLLLTLCCLFRWFLQRGCKGSRNFLDAFRHAVENEEELKKGIGKLLLSSRTTTTKDKLRDMERDLKENAKITDRVYM